MIVGNLIENSQNTAMFEESETNILDDLMNKAAIRSYLVTDDLLSAFPEAEDNMAQLEEIFIQLINQGIEVYADVEEADAASLPGELVDESSPDPVGATGDQHRPAVEGRIGRVDGGSWFGHGLLRLGGRQMSV